MVGDTTIWQIIAGSALALIIITTVAGNIFLHWNTKIATENFGMLSVYMKGWLFFLFIVMSFGFIPVVVGFFTSALVEVVTESPVPQQIHENGMLIVYGFWFILLVGLWIAYPVMVKSGFFDEENPG